MLVLQFALKLYRYNALHPHDPDRDEVLWALLQGYDSKELAAAFLAFFRGIFGGEPNRDLNISDSKFLLKCCMAAGFTEAESEQYISSSKDEIIKLRLKVRKHNPILKIL